MKPSELPFQKLCEFFEACAINKKPAMKLKHLRKFRSAYIDPHRDEAYAIYRLILPAVRGCLRLDLLPNGVPSPG